MNCKKYSFKPLDNIHFFYLLLGLAVLIFFDVVLIVVPFELSIFMVIMSLNCIPVIGFVLARVFYNVRYEIEGDVLSKYRGRELVFQIKKEDIEEIYIKKAKAIDFFGFSYQAILGPFTKPYGTRISIAYYNCGITKQETQEIPRGSLVQDNYKRVNELCEIMSYARSLKLCKMLDISPVFI